MCRLWLLRTLTTILIALALGGCGLRPPNPEHEAERMAIEACRETANNFGGTSALWNVSFDMCMDQSGYARKDRNILWP